MMYLLYEWKEKRARLKHMEDMRKAVNDRIWKNLNAELKAARKAKDWEQSNYLKVMISNYRYEKRGAYWSSIVKFDALNSGFRKWDY